MKTPINTIQTQDAIARQTQDARKRGTLPLESIVSDPEGDDSGELTKPRRSDSELKSEITQIATDGGSVADLSPEAYQMLYDRAFNEGDCPIGTLKCRTGDIDEWMDEHLMPDYVEQCATCSGRGWVKVIYPPGKRQTGCLTCGGSGVAGEVVDDYPHLSPDECPSGCGPERPERPGDYIAGKWFSDAEIDKADRLMDEQKGN